MTWCARGVPNLSDGVWLYGSGSVTDIEATILYGIRSGHPKAHNLTDMPGFDHSGQLTDADISDVIEYVMLISAQPHDPTAATRGRVIYDGAGVCYDCHTADGYGISDYGTPADGSPSCSWDSTWAWKWDSFLWCWHCWLSWRSCVA